jgi:hypothetical protein
MGKLGSEMWVGSKNVARRIYEAKITPAAAHDPIVVSVPADDPEQATQLIEAQFGPVKHWWSQPNPKANGQGDS